MPNHCSLRGASQRLTGLLLALIVAVIVLSAGGTAIAETKAEQAAALATEAIERGRTGRYLDAIALFQRAYELDPAPMLLYNIGRVRLRIDDLKRAKETLERYLATETDPNGLVRGREALEQTLARWHGRVRVVTSEADVTVEIDGDVVGRSPLSSPLGLAPGRHVLRAYKPGRIPYEEEFSLNSGQEVDVKVVMPSVASIAAAAEKKNGAGSARNDLSGRTDLRAPGEDGKPDRTLMWVLIGSGTAALIAGGVTAAVLLSQDGDASPSADGVWSVSAPGPGRGRGL